MADLSSVARNYYHAGSHAEFRAIILEALKIYEGRGKGSIESHFLETALDGSADVWRTTSASKVLCCWLRCTLTKVIIPKPRTFTSGC